MMAKHAHAQRGVTLIELLIVVTIIAVIAAFATANYSQYVQRTYRTEAKTALERIRANQERFYLQNNTYAGAIADLGMGATTEHGYDLSITAADARGFTAQAVPGAGTPNSSDAECQSFTINERGVRGSAPSAPDICWER